jgi:hypothetical protein
VAVAEQLDQLAAVSGHPATVHRIGRETIRSGDVVGVSGSFDGFGAVDGDGACFVKVELGSLDEVREVGLVER